MEFTLNDLQSNGSRPSGDISVLMPEDMQDPELFVGRPHEYRQPSFLAGGERTRACVQPAPGLTFREDEANFAVLQLGIYPEASLMRQPLHGHAAKSICSVCEPDFLTRHADCRKNLSHSTNMFKCFVGIAKSSREVEVARRRSSKERLHCR